MVQATVEAEQNKLEPNGKYKFILDTAANLSFIRKAISHPTNRIGTQSPHTEWNLPDHTGDNNIDTHENKKCGD